MRLHRSSARRGAVVATLAAGLAVTVQVAGQQEPERQLKTIDHDRVTLDERGSIRLDGKVDASTVDLTATGWVSVTDKVDGGSRLKIHAGSWVQLGDKDDRHSGIVGGSEVDVWAKGKFTAGSKVDDAGTILRVWESTEVEIVGKIDGGAQVFLHSTGEIKLDDKVDNGNTVIKWWAPKPPTTKKGVNAGARVIKENWGGFAENY